MLRLSLLVFLTAQSILALKAFDIVARDDDMSERRDVTFSGTKFSTLAELPSYVAVVTGSTGSVIATVIIVNRYWVVGSQDGLFSVTSAKDLTVYARVLSITDLTAAAVLKRRCKQIISDATYTQTKSILKPLVLIRICPSFPTGMAATLSTTSFPLATDVRMMVYNTDNMYYEEKKVGEICECSDIPNFESDPATSTHVCLQGDSPISANPSFLGLMIVTRKSDGAIIGFLVKEQGADTGEVVINVPKFNSWITTNAVPTGP